MNGLQEIIDDSEKIVFFGGAGVSTESGIPDFRSVDGLYNQKYDYPPETIISHSFFVRYPEEFYRFYRDKMIFPDAKPNDAHKKLAELEKCGKFYPLSAITESAGVPKCSCGGTIKPDVVLYEESLKTEDIERAVSEISAADTLIIGGTSLVVYPAAGLVRYFKGKHLAVINKSEINANNAELVINDSIGKVMSKIICERKENG